MVIVIGNEKGGTGKTTLTTNLTAQRVLAGHSVLLIDADPQGSAFNWAQVREEAGVVPRVACVQQFGKRLQATIKEQARQYEDILIDTGGRGDLTELRAALEIAEKILVPVQASQFDLWTLARMDDLVATARRSNPALGAFVVIGRSSPHPLVSEAAEVRSVLADYTQLEVTASVIRERVVYRRSIRDGLAVREFSPPNKKAIQELRSLYEEVFHQRQTARLGVR